MAASLQTPTKSTCTVTHVGAAVIQNLHRFEPELRRSEDDGDPFSHR